MMKCYTTMVLSGNNGKWENEKSPQMGTCFESRTGESLLAFAFHFRKSGATLEAAFAFLGSSVFEGFEPRTLRLVLFLRNSSDSSRIGRSCPLLST